MADIVLRQKLLFVYVLLSLLAILMATDSGRRGIQH